MTSQYQQTISVKLIICYSPPVLSHSYIATHMLTKREAGSFFEGRVKDLPYLYAHAIRPLYATLMLSGLPERTINH